MTFTVSITSQGQFSIPAKFRQKLGLEKNTKAFVTEQNGKLLVEPVKDFLQLRGSIKTDKKPLPNRKLHEFVAQAFADEYREKMKKTK
jgi:AbrB family looped-hinge helix DNA binding protein